MAYSNDVGRLPRVVSAVLLMTIGSFGQEVRDTRSRQQSYARTLADLQRQGAGRRMLDVARRMAADDPYGNGNYWISALTISLNNPSPAALAIGKRAAEQLLKNLPVTFALDRCPDAVPRAAWIAERERQGILGTRTLAWIDLQQHRYAEAATRFRVVLEAHPNDAEASFWLATAWIGQGQPGLRSAAVYQLARSLAVKGEGELTIQARPLARRYYAEVYTALYGSQDGIERVLDEARLGPFPEQQGTAARKKARRSIDSTPKP